MASVQQELETSFPIYGSWDYPLQDPQYQSNLRSPRQLYKVVHPELPRDTETWHFMLPLSPGL